MNNSENNSNILCFRESNINTFTDIENYLKKSRTDNHNFHRGTLLINFEALQKLHQKKLCNKSLDFYY